jgi:hypothetical protein
VPIGWDEPGALGSTRAEVERVLAALAQSPDPAPLLEVETYTWPLLGPQLGGPGSLADRLADELDFAAKLLRI